VLPQSTVGSLPVTHSRGIVWDSICGCQFWPQESPLIMKSLHCPNRDCAPSKEGKAGTIIIRHGFYKARWGKRRHYQCQTCGTTFCSTNGTAYYRLQHRRTTFDKVASLSVEGLNNSPSPEPCGSAGIRCIAGWKGQQPGVGGSMIEE
jgi:hypothetical protein